MSGYLEEIEIKNGQTFSPTMDQAELEQSMLIRNYGRVRKAASIADFSSTYRLGGVGFAEVLGAHQNITSAVLTSPTSDEPEEDIWAAFERVLSQYPDDVFRDLPSDLAQQHDHYLYGTTKK